MRRRTGNIVTDTTDVSTQKSVMAYNQQVRISFGKYSREKISCLFMIYSM